MTKTKKILSVLLAICMLATLSISAFAKDDYTLDRRYRLTVTISGTSATYRVTSISDATYPIGTASASYSLDGVPRYGDPHGTSYAAYWAAYYTFPSGSRARSATTTAYGKSVNVYVA